MTADATNGLSVRDAIGEMVRIIVEKFHPNKIILFGSHARGEAGPDSDVDLMVVFPEVEHKRRTAVDIRVAISDVGLPKDVVVVTCDELERYRDVVGTLIRPALQEGKVLYGRG